MANILDNSALGEVMAELKAIHEDIQKLDRKVDDFRSAYDHHASAESRIHSALRDEVREVLVKTSGIEGSINGAISALSHDLAAVDARVGILESAV
jgi:prefoldin subunit 5